MQRARWILKQGSACCASSTRGVALIEFEDFLKLDLKVGIIRECRMVEKVISCCVSQIEYGQWVRQIVLGIAESYQPEELIGVR